MRRALTATIAGVAVTAALLAFQSGTVPSQAAPEEKGRISIGVMYLDAEPAGYNHQDTKRRDSGKSPGDQGYTPPFDTATFRTDSGATLRVAVQPGLLSALPADPKTEFGPDARYVPFRGRQAILYSGTYGPSGSVLSLVWHEDSTLAISASLQSNEGAVAESELRPLLQALKRG